MVYHLHCAARARSLSEIRLIKFFIHTDAMLLYALFPWSLATVCAAVQGPLGQMTLMSRYDEACKVTAWSDGPSGAVHETWQRQCVQQSICLVDDVIDLGSGMHAKQWKPDKLPNQTGTSIFRAFTEIILPIDSEPSWKSPLRCSQESKVVAWSTGCHCMAVDPDGQEEGGFSVGINMIGI